MIEAASARKVDVQADEYAYAAASSALAIRFPSWALEGGQIAIAARLNDPGTWAKIRTEMQASLVRRGLNDLSFAVVTIYPPDPSLQGLTMRQVASRMSGSESRRRAVRRGATR